MSVSEKTNLPVHVCKTSLVIFFSLLLMMFSSALEADGTTNSKKTKICLVANYEDTSDDHSPFIDSCDVIMRINRMTNLESGRAGFRTTHLFLDLWSEFFQGIDEFAIKYIKQNKNMELISWRGPNSPGVKKFKKLVEREDVLCINVNVKNKNKYTTLAKGYLYLRSLYPKEVVYFIGDLYRKTGNYHDDALITQMWKKEIKLGRVVHIPVTKKK